MITEAQLKILKEQARKIADRYIDDPKKEKKPVRHVIERRTVTPIREVISQEH